jgi:hypothetical protein
MRGNEIRSLGNWILIFIGLLTVAYVIFQPLVWEWLGWVLPQQSQSLSQLLPPLFIVMAIGFGALGVLAYNTLRDNMQRQVVEDVRKETEKAKKEFERFAQDTAQLVTDKAIPPVKQIADEALARIALRTSTTYYETYEKLWKPHWSKEPYDHAIESDPQWTREVERAVYASRLAYDHANALPPTDGYGSLLRLTKNNLAYHLATRKNPDDKSTARQLADEILSETDVDYDELETVAWVLLRFSDTDAPEEAKVARDKAENIIKRLVVDKRIDRQRREDVQTQYQALFGIKLELPHVSQ